MLIAVIVSSMARSNASMDSSPQKRNLESRPIEALRVEAKEFLIRRRCGGVRAGGGAFDVEASRLLGESSPVAKEICRVALDVVVHELCASLAQPDAV